MLRKLPIMLLALLQSFAYYARFDATPVTTVTVNYASS